MTTLHALLYADARSTINQLKAIRKSPGRAIMWTMFALLIAAGIVIRILRAAQHKRLPIDSFSPQTSTDAIACFIIAGFGVTLAFGSKFAGLFAHPAEARFIIGSPATPFIATLYVQTRDIIVNSARRGIALLYGALIYLPDGLSAAAFARDLAIVVAAFTTIAAVPLARQLLAKRYVGLAVAAGLLCIAAGVIAGLRDLAQALQPAPPLGPLLLAIPPWHPGALLLGGTAAQIAALGAIIVFVAVVFVFVARRARDAYPELYELSMNRLQRTERLRARSFGAQKIRANMATRAASMGGSAPAGVAIFVWRAWTEYRRSNDTRATALETAALLVAGYVTARVTGTHLMRLLPIATTLGSGLFIVALARAAALANELRRPLFWLSPATLFERLCALAAAHSWRMCSWFVLLAVGLAAGHAPLVVIGAALVGGPAAVLLAIAIGYASYGLVPHEVDQRGPMLFVRIILGYIFAMPVLAAGLGAGMFAHSVISGFGTGALTAVIESAFLIGFAAWRLDRMSIPLR
jgi:hypothetical protein